MPQATLNDPIDGAELKAIILQRIKEALSRDCTLADDIAYAGFRLDYQINLKYLRSKTEGTLVWGSTTQSLSEPLMPEDIKAAPVETITDSYASDSPNRAREDHSLPVPVMIQTPSGPIKRKIHVNPREPKK